MADVVHCSQPSGYSELQLLQSSTLGRKSVSFFLTGYIAKCYGLLHMWVDVD